MFGRRSTPLAQTVATPIVLWSPQDVAPLPAARPSAWGECCTNGRCNDCK